MAGGNWVHRRVRASSACNCIQVRPGINISDIDSEQDRGLWSQRQGRLRCPKLGRMESSVSPNVDRLGAIVAGQRHPDDTPTTRGRRVTSADVVRLTGLSRATMRPGRCARRSPTTCSEQPAQWPGRPKPWPVVRPCAAPWSTSRLGSRSLNASQCCTCPRTGPGQRPGSPCGSASSVNDCRRPSRPEPVHPRLRGTHRRTHRGTLGRPAARTCLWTSPRLTDT